MIELPIFLDYEKAYYVSGPMTGYDNYNRLYFTSVTHDLREIGLRVVSPHESDIVAGTEWDECMRIVMKELLTCDAIIMLQGWPQSRGARIEMQLAADLGMLVYYLHGLRLLDMNKEGLSP